MKRSLKIVMILICILLAFFSVNVQASSDLSWNSIKDSVDDFENAGKEESLISTDKIIDAVVQVGQMITAVGVDVLFGELILLGIKYMTEEKKKKGKLKQQLIGLVIAGIVIFGAFSIWRVAYNFFEEVF